MLGAGGAAALGLGLGNGGPNAKLSKERKHRMRELATKKLAQAYALDEIAASVATMQSASSLEEVAKLVLQRNAGNSDAKYVHFFHEKIPSRMLAQCTSLKPLDEIIHEKPNSTATLRTRAVTKIFKDDYVGAARDLTDALSSHRYHVTQHNAERGPDNLMNSSGNLDHGLNNAEEISYDSLLNKDEQPGSSEPQLLFHRAGVYLSLACHNVKLALDGSQETPKVPKEKAETTLSLSSSDQDQDRIQREARKLVKSYAKRALRDYMGFLSNFDYTPGLPYAVTKEFFPTVNVIAGNSAKSKAYHSTRKLLEMSGNTNLSNGSLSDAVTSHRVGDRGTSMHRQTYASASHSVLPTPEVYHVSSLFSSTPVNLPPYPNESTSLVLQSRTTTGSERASYGALDRFERHEAVTYHPLLTDALHSLLLCHSLMQTSVKEHLRHAHMVGRLARLCDGYPIFLAARSPSRADWIEVIRRVNNWIGLQQSWETLCAPAPLPGQGWSIKEETEEQVRERNRQEAIMEALADERVHDEASFQAAVGAREKRAEDQRKDIQAGGGAKRWAQNNNQEYPISTERAELISRWVKEACRTTAISPKLRGIMNRREVTQVEGERIPEPSGLDD